MKIAPSLKERNRNSQASCECHHLDLRAQCLFQFSESCRVFAASEWLPKDKIETILMENITDNQYSTFLKTFECLSRHAYAYIEKDFIMQFRRNLAPPSELQDIPKVTTIFQKTNHLDNCLNFV